MFDGMTNGILNLGSRVVNNYLLPSKAGYILIDTGYDGSFPRFMKGLKKHRIAPGAIKYVFLTHAHDDHAGFLNEVLAATDAQVILHPKAVESLRRGQNSFEGGCSSRLAFLFCKVLALFGHGEHRYPPIRDAYLDRLVPIDSDRFRALDFPFEIMKTPGHTADHIALLAGDVLFCGDAAMNGFPSVRRTIIWIEDLRQYKQSWEAILERAPAWLYPGHGRPFRTSDLRRYMGSLDRVKLYALPHGVRGDGEAEGGAGVRPAGMRNETMVRDGQASGRFDRGDRIARVKRYERLFDEATACPDAEKLRQLDAYYTSGAWREDYEADERGEFPPDLKRGVLAQDALYDLLEGANDQH